MLAEGIGRGNGGEEGTFAHFALTDYGAALAGGDGAVEVLYFKGTAVKISGIVDALPVKKGVVVMLVRMTHNGQNYNTLASFTRPANTSNSPTVNW